MAWFTSLLVEPFYRLVYGRLPASRGEDIPAHGLVLVADGVGGLDLCGIGLRYMLGVERLPYAVELFPWGHGFGRWFADLTDVSNRDHQARLVAEVVRHFRSDHPEQPVFLVAKSGGSGIVVKALEQLEDESVERVVLLAPALSPGYDLTRALRRAPGGRRLLVAAGYRGPGRRDAPLRHDRSGQDRSRGPGGLSRSPPGRAGCRARPSV